ncbi:MAG: hypothetical protein COA67_08445 [Lutibacter sp.]|nr:MAG: hypothetical protein COA67_08445 [Lutibacter sp.]
MSTHETNVYITNQSGTDFYSNNNNGIGNFNKVSTGTSMVYADALTDQNGVVYLPMDNPTLILFKSIDEGSSLNQTTLNPSGLVYFSSYALSDGPCGTFIFVGGGSITPSETLGYKINVNTGELTEIILGENVLTNEGRTLFADNKGTLIDGYRSGNGDLVMNVSTDQGNNFNPPIVIASGESHNISRNPFTEDVLVVYQIAGEIFLSVYDNILKNIEIPEINPSISICPSDSFDLPFILSDGFSPNTEFTVSLSDEFGDFSNSTQIGSIITNTSGTINCTIPSNSITGDLYKIQIESLSNCIQSNKIPLIIGKANITGPTEVCENDTIQLFGSGTPNSNNPWTSLNTDVASIDNQGILTGLNSGTTEISYITNNNCIGTYLIEVLESDLTIISISDIQIIDDSNNNSITISSVNFDFGDYEFSLDDEFGIYQEETTFNHVSAGIHILYIRSKNQCETIYFEIYILGFPNFFTPNNDGFNDYWNITGLNNSLYPNSKIHIYDRFGKIISIINTLSEGWDGLYNGKELPETDYWFSVELVDNEGDIRLRKGHFSLIRR